MLYLVAVAWCGPAVASVYQPLIPVFTVVLAIITGMEPVFPCGEPPQCFLTTQQCLLTT